MGGCWLQARAQTLWWAALAKGALSAGGDSVPGLTLYTCSAVCRLHCTPAVAIIQALLSLAWRAVFLTQMASGHHPSTPRSLLRRDTCVPLLKCKSLYCVHAVSRTPALPTRVLPRCPAACPSPGRQA